jgi:flagellar biosynthetic protein FlhB
MTDAHTERVSPRKLAALGHSRPMSRALCGAVAVVALGLALDLRSAGRRLEPRMTATFEAAQRSDVSLAEVTASVVESARVFGEICWPLLTAILVSVLFAGVVQRLAPFAAGRARASDRPSPFDVAARFRQLFAPERALDALVGVLMVLALAGVTWLTLAPNVRGVLALSSARPTSAAPALLELFATLAWRLSLSAVVLGALDYLQRRVRFAAGIRMTQRELRQEQREQYGDPAVRAERARLRATTRKARP